MATKLLIACLVFVGAAVATEPQPRFERISDQHNDPKYNHVAVLEVWHDTVSGQEFVCAVGHDADGGVNVAVAWPLSCWPTGRNWKR